MTDNHVRKEFVPTNVPGLDHVLQGGFLREGYYLLQADPGSGKTTVALQYVLGRLRAGEPCLYVTLTESRRDLENACRSHGWPIEGLRVCDLTDATAHLNGGGGSVFHPSETELGEITQSILAQIERASPRHVVFDGLAELRLLSGDAFRYRRQLLALKQFFESRRITALLLDDRSTPFGDVHPEGLVGGSLVMERFLPVYGKARRRLYVTKVRGARFREGYNDYEITHGGVVVHPRLVAAEHHETFARTTYASGIAGLDEMLAGGLPAGTTTLLLGPAGVGKSTTAMQFVFEALRRGVRAAVYTFDEVIGTLFDRSEKLCPSARGGDLRQYLEAGTLHVQQIDSAEMTAGAFAHEVGRAVETGAKLIVIDSLNGYVNAMPEERFLVTHLHELFAYLNQQGVVTIMVVAQHGLMAGGMSDLDVSYLADTVLMYRYFECRGEIQQAISVFKKRTGPHQRTLRQLRITEEGMVVGEPLSGFRGIMTGVPVYDGETELLQTPAPVIRQRRLPQ